MPTPPVDPVLARRAALGVLRTLRDAGHTAYFAGGCVRDELLGQSPVDYDVATDATPQRISGLFPRTAEVGAHFGVVLVHEQGVTVEVATFRADGPYSDRRRPDSVTFSDPKADALRRDFTINALFLDPLDHDPDGRAEGGRLIDFVGGAEDLERGVIRAVGDPDQRLAEDHLRALRAVRFAARLGFEIDEPTADAIRRHASELRGVSRERIGDELRRMFADRARHHAAWTLQYLWLDEPVLEQAHKDAAPTSLARLPDQAEYPTCLAAWAMDRGEVVEATQIAGVVSTYRTALCLTNDERDRLRDILKGVAVLRHAWPGLSVAEQKRTAASDWFVEALRLVSTRDPEHMARIRQGVDALARTPSGLAPSPLLSGDDLVAEGYRTGPAFGQLLAHLYDAQLEDRVATREEALELARELAGRLGVEQR